MLWWAINCNNFLSLDLWLTGALLHRIKSELYQHLFSLKWHGHVLNTRGVLPGNPKVIVFTCSNIFSKFSHFSPSISPVSRHNINIPTQIISSMQKGGVISRPQSSALNNYQTFQCRSQFPQHIILVSPCPGTFWLDLWICFVLCRQYFILHQNKHEILLIL